MSSRFGNDARKYTKRGKEGSPSLVALPVPGMLGLHVWHKKAGSLLTVVESVFTLFFKTQTCKNIKCKIIDGNKLEAWILWNPWKLLGSCD